MPAEALPEITSTGNLRAVQILPNHHARLASITPDFGPIVCGRYLFPNYLFLASKPPGYFWDFTGVVRCLKSEVHPAELDRARQSYLDLQLQRAQDHTLGMLQSAVVAVHSVDGQVIATIELFGRSLKVKVAA